MEENKFIKGIYNEYLGKKLQSVAELEVYLSNPVGVGEHPDVSKEIKTKLEQVAHYDGVITLINNLFTQDKSQEKTKQLPTKE